MLALLPVGHEPCFFLKGAFLKRLPADIRAHLLRDDFSDPISFAFKADEIYQSRVSSSHVYAVSSTPEDQQSINAVRSTVPNHPRRTPHARIAGPSLLPCLITIVHYHGVPRPRNAELCVPCRETSSLPGGCSFTEFIEIPDRFWCFGISVSCSTFLFYLIRSQVAYSGWFLSHMLRFSDYPFTIWDPQV